DRGANLRVDGTVQAWDSQTGFYPNRPDAVGIVKMGRIGNEIFGLRGEGKVVGLTTDMASLEPPSDFALRTPPGRSSLSRKRTEAGLHAQLAGAD
ncbi:MAG: hypothetical protein AAGH89_08530, partial [Verrucomicrobiota bacterium]